MRNLAEVNFTTVSPEKLSYKIVKMDEVDLSLREDLNQIHEISEQSKETCRANRSLCEHTKNDFFK